MVIKIGEKIKELRKKSDITQERFAEYLGVTAQAVSKWEVESGYPDIELLPSIANFFDVTIDELMGFDISKKQQKIDSILVQMQMHLLKGTAVEFLKNAVREFPNSYKLLYHLAYHLRREGKNDEEKLKNAHESIAICNRILEDCTNDDILRTLALENLAYSYNKIGDKAKAIETANKFPFISRESVLAKIVGEYRETGIDISAQKGSVVIEGLELFADENHIQPIVESLDSLTNAAGQINIDFADIVKIVKNNNAYFANYIPIRDIAEDVKHSRKNLVKGVIVDVKVSPDVKLDAIDTFMNNIVKSFGYGNLDIIFGVGFDNTMTGNEVAGSVIELSSYA